jgi:hypothetical protein
MSELHGHVEKLWSSPTPQTVVKMNVPYKDGLPCPVCAGPIFEEQLLTGAVDYFCFCGWRREKSPAKLQDYLPGQLAGMCKKPKDHNYGWRKEVVVTYIAIPGVLAKLVKESGKSANKLEQSIPVHMGALKRWDIGQYGMSAENRRKISKYFGIEEDQIATVRIRQDRPQKDKQE